MPYRHARITELEAPPSNLVDGEWKPVRHLLDTGAFGANGYVARAVADVLVEEHDESTTGFEERYVMLAGELDFRVGGDSFVARAGELVFVPPELSRVGRARTPDAAALAIGAVPGRAFEVCEWETRRLS